jgi:hypothetical protein
LIICAALTLTAAPSALAAITCTASNTTVNFGPYDVLSGATLPASGSIVVTCVNANVRSTRVTYTARLAIAPTRQMGVRRNRAATSPPINHYGLITPTTYAQTLVVTLTCTPANRC